MAAHLAVVGSVISAVTAADGDSVWYTQSWFAVAVTVTEHLPHVVVAIFSSTSLAQNAHTKSLLQEKLVYPILTRNKLLCGEVAETVVLNLRFAAVVRWARKDAIARGILFGAIAFVQVVYTLLGYLTRSLPNVVRGSWCCNRNYLSQLLFFTGPPLLCGAGLRPLRAASFGDIDQLSLYGLANLARAIGAVLLDVPLVVLAAFSRVPDSLPVLVLCLVSLAFLLCDLVGRFSKSQIFLVAVLCGAVVTPHAGRVVDEKKKNLLAS